MDVREVAVLEQGASGLDQAWQRPVGIRCEKSARDEDRPHIVHVSSWARESTHRSEHVDAGVGADIAGGVGQDDRAVHRPVRAFTVVCLEVANVPAA